MPALEDDPVKVILCVYVCIHIGDWQANIKPQSLPFFAQVFLGLGL